MKFTSFIRTNHALTTFRFILLTITPFLTLHTVSNAENMNPNAPLVNNQFIDNLSKNDLHTYNYFRACDNNVSIVTKSYTMTTLI